MRQYNIEEIKTLKKIVCNKCGKEILVHNDVPDQDVLCVQQRWGYFSNKDNEVHHFDLCEECYDEWISTFQIPVDIENR